MSEREQKNTIANNISIPITESVKTPDKLQPQKSYGDDIVVASTETIMAALLESEPQYENLYRRLANI